MLVCMELYVHSPICLHIVHGDIVLCVVTLLLFRAVGIPTGYGRGGLGFAPPPGVPIGGGGARFHTRSDCLRGPLTVGTWSLSRGVKRPGREVNHEPFSSASVRSCYIYRLKFTFILVPSIHGICGK
jgi:hypothetical protein